MQNNNIDYDNEFILKLNKLCQCWNKYSGKRNTSYVSLENDISIEDLYYILKFYGIKISDNNYLKYIEKLFLNKYIKKEILSKLMKLKMVDDNRILIIPRQIEFHPLITYSFNPILLSLDELNLDKEKNAIYLSNWGQVNTIYRVLKDKESRIDYLLVKHGLIDSYNQVYRKPLFQKIVEIPDCIQYSELSLYLDENIQNQKQLVRKF